MSKHNGSEPTTVEPNYFYTESGTKIPIKAVSMLDLVDIEKSIEADYREKGLILPIPEYEVDLAGGGKIKYALTDSNLEVEGNPEESMRRQLAWNDYQASMNRMKAEQGNATLSLLYDGIDVQLPEDDAWIKRREKRHQRVPDDLDDRLLYYKQREILKTPNDILRAQSAIIILSSSGAIDKRAVDAAGDTFRRTVEEIAGRTAEPLEDAAGPVRQDREGTLGTQPAPKRAGRSKGLGRAKAE